MNLKQPQGRPPKYTEDQRLEVIRIATSTVGLNARIIGEMAGVPGWKVLEWLTLYQKQMDATRGESAQNEES